MRMGFRLTGLLLAIMTIGGMLLASCTDSQSSVSATPTPASTKPTGSLIVAGTFRTGSIDPVEAGNTSTFRGLAAAFFDSLVELDANGQPTPGLAEKYTLAADGMSLTFVIRKGVKFHDGSDLTAADVKFSLDRIIAPASTHNDAAEWRTQVASVDIIDDFTVVIKMKQAQAELLKGMYELSGSTAVMPKKYIEEKGVDFFRKNPMGTGPYKVVKYESGIRVDLEAVDSHWRETPKFKNVTFLAVPEEGTKVAMLKTGELDIADVQPDSAPGLKSAGLKVATISQGSQSFVYTFYDVNNPDKFIYGDQKVRHAMALSINRKEMADVLYGGYAEPSTLWFVRPSAYFFDPSVLKPDPYDPDGAKKLLAEAGYANGFDTRLWDTGGVNTMYMQAIGGYFRKVGIRGDTVPIEYAVLSTMWRPLQKPEIWNAAWGWVGAAGGMQFEKFMQAYHSTKGAVKTMKNAQLDDLIDRVPRTADPVEKKKIALQAAVLAKNDYGVIAVLDHQTLYAYGSKVGSMTFTTGVPELALRWSSVTHAK